MTLHFNFTRLCTRATWLLVWMGMNACTSVAQTGAKPTEPPTQVTLQTAAQKSALYVNGKPFYIRGAGL